MNEHVPDELQKKWAYAYEFKGKPVKKSNGKTYIRAEFKHWPWKGHSHIYCFEDDFFWHDMPFKDVP